MYLTLRSGPGAPRRVEVTGERFVVGRDKACDLVLRDEQASRRHAAFAPSPTGLLLEDLDSYNGTYVDGRRIEIPVSLRGGEEVRVGDTVLEVSGGAGEDERAPAARRPRSAVQRMRLERSLRRTKIVAALACVVAAAAVALLLTGVLGSGDGPDRDDGRSVSQVVRTLTRSNALVLARSGARRAGSGSSWVLDAGAGLLVTNAHVLVPGRSFQAGVGGRPRPARVLGVSPCDDLAVLEVADRAGLRSARLGSQRELRQGDTVVAMGYPGNASARDELQSTVGHVSLPRTSFGTSGDPDLQRYPNVIQTDTTLNPGNSGGPLIGLDERVVGVNTATFRGRGSRTPGQAYAIAIDHARPVIRRLRRGRSIGWGGFGFRAITRREQRGNDLPAGLLVRGVVEGTPAAGTSLARGPALIVDIGGRRVRTFSDYCRAVRRVRSGQVVQIGYFGRRGRAQARVRFE
jgi:S1-C subfamily serine protease